MIEAWKANPDLARRRLIDNLVGKPPAYLADRGEKASFFLSIFLGLAAGVLSVKNIFDRYGGGETPLINLLLYSTMMFISSSILVMIITLAVTRGSIFLGRPNAITSVISVLVLQNVVEAVGGFVLITANWDVIWANRQLLMFGPHLTSHPEELWRFWPPIYLVAFLIGGAYGSLGESRLKFLIPFTLFALISLFILYNPNHRGYDYESTMVKLSMAFAVTYISFLITHKKLTGADEYLIVRFHRWLTITAVITFFVALFTLDPPGDDITFGSMEITGVPPSLWGGFVMNVLVATAGCVLGFGLGIVLAFGRRSNLAAYRYPSTAIIELIRSGPLVAWLFIAFILLPDVLNPIWESDVVMRMILIISIFGGCYGAEIIRGGLQAVPSGQIEAATALGLSNMQTKLLVELPNAIRTTLPTIVSLFIGLWKDTTLLYLLGVHEMFNLSTLALTQQKEFLGLTRETLVFAGMAFWILAFYLSRISLRIESGLGLGHEGGGEAT